MSWIQDVAPNYNAPAVEDECLGYVTGVFNAPKDVDYAKLSWEGAVGRNTAHIGDRNTPSNVALPYYFTWVGTINKVRRDWGHVVVYNPGDKMFYSTSFTGNGLRKFSSIAEIEKALPGSFLGFTEDVDGLRIAHQVSDHPVVVNTLIPQSGTATVTTDKLNVRSAANRAAPVVATYQEGETFTYDAFIDADSHRWLSYVSYGNKRRYVAESEGDDRFVSGGVN